MSIQIYGSFLKLYLLLVDKSILQMCVLIMKYIQVYLKAKLMIIKIQILTISINITYCLNKIKPNWIEIKKSYMIWQIVLQLTIIQDNQDSVFNDMDKMINWYSQLNKNKEHSQHNILIYAEHRICMDICNLECTAIFVTSNIIWIFKSKQYLQKWLLQTS